MKAEHSPFRCFLVIGRSLHRHPRPPPAPHPQLRTAPLGPRRTVRSRDRGPGRRAPAVLHCHHAGHHRHRRRRPPRTGHRLVPAHRDVAPRRRSLGRTGRHGARSGTPLPGRRRSGLDDRGSAQNPQRAGRLRRSPGHRPGAPAHRLHPPRLLPHPRRTRHPSLALPAAPGQSPASVPPTPSHSTPTPSTPAWPTASRPPDAPTSPPSPSTTARSCAPASATTAPARATSPCSFAKSSTPPTPAAQHPPDAPTRDHPSATAGRHIQLRPPTRTTEAELMSLVNTP